MKQVVQQQIPGQLHRALGSPQKMKKPQMNKSSKGATKKGKY